MPLVPGSGYYQVYLGPQRTPAVDILGVDATTVSLNEKRGKPGQLSVTFEGIDSDEIFNDPRLKRNSLITWVFGYEDGDYREDTYIIKDRTRAPSGGGMFKLTLTAVDKSVGLSETGFQQVFTNAKASDVAIAAAAALGLEADVVESAIVYPTISAGTSSLGELLEGLAQDEDFDFQVVNGKTLIFKPTPRPGAPSLPKMKWSSNGREEQLRKYAMKRSLLAGQLYEKELAEILETASPDQFEALVYDAKFRNQNRLAGIQNQLAESLQPTQPTESEDLSTLLATGHKAKRKPELYSLKQVGATPIIQLYYACHAKEFIPDWDTSPPILNDYSITDSARTRVAGLAAKSSGVGPDGKTLKDYQEIEWDYDSFVLDETFSATSTAGHILHGGERDIIQDDRVIGRTAANRADRVGLHSQLQLPEGVGALPEADRRTILVAAGLINAEADARIGAARATTDPGSVQQEAQIQSAISFRDTQREALLEAVKGQMLIDPNAEKRAGARARFIAGSPLKDAWSLSVRNFNQATFSRWAKRRISGTVTGRLLRPRDVVQIVGVMDEDVVGPWLIDSTSVRGSGGDISATFTGSAESTKPPNKPTVDLPSKQARTAPPHNPYKPPKQIGTDVIDVTADGYHVVGESVRYE